LQVSPKSALCDRWEDGSFIRKKRIDLSLSMPGLAKSLGFGITDTAIEKWEKNQNRPTEPYRTRLVEFIGFDPKN
jgi:DNA-binding transcriptional regulator YiaG